MTRAEKFTTIYNAFKAIKTAITGKGVTVSGDITTYADAITAIPVGVQLETGTILGSGTASLTISGAIGKSNIAIFGENAWSSQSICTGYSIGGNNGNVYVGTSVTPTYTTTATWNSESGTFTGSRYYWKNTCRYRWIAW